MIGSKPLRFALCLAAVALVFAQPAKRLMTVDDQHRFHDVRDVQISPDGKWVAYTVSSVDVTADKSDTDIWMANWDGTQQVRLTSSPDGENAPRWSPDGRYVSFLSSRTGGKARGNQIWLLDRTGGEAQQMTDFKTRLASYEWSPDGKRILMTITERDPNAPDDEQQPNGGGAGGRGGPNVRAPKPIVIDRYKFKQDVQGYLTQPPGRVFVYDVATKKAEPLTREGFEVGPATWSPDGKFVAFMGKEGKDAERYNLWNVYVMEAQPGATPKKLTNYDGVTASGGRGRPEWSPDGTRLVYLQGSGAKWGAYNMNRIAVVAVAGGEPKLPAQGFDRGAQSPRFTKDGQILFLEADDRWEYPALVSPNGGKVERMVKGPGLISTIEQGKDGRYAVLAASDATHSEIHALENGGLRPLTHHNDELMAQLKIGATEEFSCKAKDGNEVHGLITKPPDYEPGKKYPTLLRIHGGPNGQDAHSFNYERQIFAANGYVVVNVNYRGSSGRGEEYQRAIAADWGNKEVIDLEAAVDHVIAIGLADPERLGVGGWSYGGILTDAIIAKDQRFKAATSGAGTAFPLALYGVDQYILQYNEEIGAPWKVGIEPWTKISYGFMHADQIKTPTLFMGGEKDFNVPLAGGEEMYQALATLGVPTQLVVYPNSFHGITRPSYQKDRVERYLAWYAKYLK
ncbi:MAG TPA: S9 family peptidase [Bryobacteraceae bacterium]|jgi:dipeptidyl aminopeptidase/acylaminoacyl peptidase